MKLYLNGILLSKERVTVTKSANTEKFTKLVLGAADELIPYVSESYEIEIDDFAVWLTSLSDAEVTYVMKESKETIYFCVFLSLLTFKTISSSNWRMR